MNPSLFGHTRKTLLFAGLFATALAAASVQAAPGRYRFNQTNTPGWTLMSPQERAEYQHKMLAAKTYDECKAIQAEHHKEMEVRAKEKGITLGAPRYNACDRMKARGLLK